MRRDYLRQLDQRRPASHGGLQFASPRWKHPRLAWFRWAGGDDLLAFTPPAIGATTQLDPAIRSAQRAIN